MSSQKILTYDGKPVTEDNPFPVTAELELSDIQIGAVEIKDGDTNDRVEVDANNSMKTKLSINGSDVSDLNPLPTTQQLKISTEIDENSFDLQSAAFNDIVIPSFDYIIDNFSLDFSSNESRTITLLSDNGTKIYESINNTNLTVAVSSINFGQATGQSFTLDITQTSGVCNVDIQLQIKNSPVALTADPVIAPGINNIGNIALLDANQEKITIQNPLRTSGDSVYCKDIWVSESDTTDWTDADGVGGDVVCIPFNNLHTGVINTTSDSVKSFLVHFNRTVSLDQVGLGCASHPGETFSNVKIAILGSGEVERAVLDESDNNTKYTSRNYQFGPELCNAIKLEFHTTDSVCFTNCTIQKIIKTESRLTALKPNGNLTNIGATNNNNLRVSIQEYGDTPAIDAFSRLRVSEPFTLFDSKQLNDKSPLFWDEELGGNATSIHDTSDARTRISVTANVNDYAIRQTKQRFNYQPGKSQLSFLTFYNEQVEGLTKRVGLFEGTGTNFMTPYNGVFYETNGNISWNIAKDGLTTESATQSEWNVDTLDGSGDENNPSGIELKTNATQIAIIDYEWLGVGRVRVGFVIDGLIYYVHHFNHANNSAFDSVYMSTPNLPIRYDIQSNGTSAGYLDHICSSVISEGGVEKTGILRSEDTGDSFITGLSTSNKYALVGVRLKDLYKDVSILPESVQLFMGTNDAFKWELHINPVIDGTWTYTDLTNSAVQTAKAVNNTNSIITDGIVIARGGGSTSTRESGSILQTALKNGSTIAGVQDELVVVIKPFGSNLSAWACLNWRELL